MRSIIVRTRDDDALRRVEARLAIQILVLIPTPPAGQLLHAS